MNLREAPAKQGKTSLWLAAEMALDALESLDCGGYLQNTQCSISTTQSTSATG
jgi:hypothetical protein